MAMSSSYPMDVKHNIGSRRDLEAVQEIPKQRKPFWHRFVHFAVPLFVLVWLLHLRFPHRNPAGSIVNDNPPIVDDFRDIEPSTSLKWQPCFWDDMQCAMLRVPMDYNRPLSQSCQNPTVEIAVIMKPGRNHTVNGDYSVSPILINPGGPGGSGVGLVLGAGSRIQQVVGDEYDIIGFDPRSVGYSTPTADCFSFPSSGGTEVDEHDIAQGQFNRLAYLISNEAIGLVNTSEVALTKIDNGARAVAKLCEQKDALQGNNSILRHLDTPNVARDMVSIVDAWDAWRDASLREEQIQAEIEVQDSTRGKLVYIGFSYGTLLGATFAAMFPDRVGRVILDGVVDADLYVSPVWAESIIDSDAILESFFTYCAKAGAEECDIARQGDSAEDIKERVHADLNALQRQSLIGTNPRTNTPSIITWTMFKAIAFQGLYAPIQWFPVYARLLDALHRGNYPLLHASLLQGHMVVRYQPYCGTHLPSSFDPGDATYSIECADKRYALNESLPLLQERFETMARNSSFADLWMSAMVGCDGWGIETVDPPMRWDDHPARKPKPVKTSFPLLFVSTTFDPVCPLTAAVKMAKKFVNAGLIEQRSEGHCSISAVSLCTIKKMRDYIRDGKVPAPPKLDKGQDLREGTWERCDADEWPWHQYRGDIDFPALLETGGHDVVGDNMTPQESREMIQAWKGIQDYLAESGDFMKRLSRAKGRLDMNAIEVRLNHFVMKSE